MPRPAAPTASQLRAGRHRRRPDVPCAGSADARQVALPPAAAPAAPTAARRALRAMLLASTALLPAGAGVAQAPPAPNARPQGGNVVAGQAAIGQTATQTTVTQSSNRAVVEWQRFDVGRNHTVEFQQPSAQAWTLNRVTTPDPSVIAGRVTANGGVAIVNQSGVVFAQGAQVNVGALIASAANITNENFMAGRMVFDGTANPGARVENHGQITIADGGLAVLAGPHVTNAGQIRARLGRVALAGGEAFALDMAGDGLLSVEVTQAARTTGNGATALVTNSGVVEAQGGSVLLTAAQASGLVEDVVRQSGRVSANADPATGRTGQAALRGQGGGVRMEGVTEATGAAPGTRGGTVTATGTRVTLAPGARADASGTAGGGAVRLGGAGTGTAQVAGEAAARGTAAGARGGTVTAQARDEVRIRGGARLDAAGAAGGGTVLAGTTGIGRRQEMARTTTVEPGATLAADATAAGQGGTVVVNSTEATAMRGDLSARGGPEGGSGGFIEISGQAALHIAGTADTRAPAGSQGQVLIDPRNIIISDNATPNVGGAPNTVTADQTTPPAGAAPQTISATTGADTEWLRVSTNTITDFGAGDLTLDASRQIIVDTAVNRTTAGGLTLNAGTDLTVRAGASVTVNGALTLAAGGTLSVNAPVTSGTGTPVTLQADTMALGERVAAPSGEIVLRGAAASRPVFLGAEDATGLSLSAAEIALLGGGAAGTTNPATALRVTTAGTVTINGDVALGRGTDTRIQALAIEGAASVAQTAGVVDVATLRGSSTGDFALNWLNAGAAVNTIGTLGQITATTGAVDIRNAAALSVTGPVLAGGAVTLGAGGALDLGTATISANGGAGATTLTAGGTISQTAGGAGALVTSRLNLASTGAAQSADLRGTGNELAELQSSLGGAVALTNSAAATLTVAGTGIAAGAGDVTLTSGAIVVAAPVTTTGTVGLAATGSVAASPPPGTVTQSAAITAGMITGQSSGAFTLDNAANAIGTATGIVTTNGAITLRDTGDLTLGSLTAGGANAIDVQAPGQLSVTGPLQAGGAVTLGATELTTAGTGTITAGTGTPVTLQADTMALGARVAAPSGEIVLRGAAANRPVFLGAEDAAGLSLSTAEIALLGGGGAAGTTNPATALRVTTAGAVTINGDVALGRGTDTRIQALAIEGAASVAQTAGVVDVATLRGSSTGDFALNWLNAGAAVNTIGTLGQITATTGAVDIRNATGLSVTGPLQAGGAVTLGATELTTAGTGTITAGTGTPVTLQADTMALGARVAAPSGEIVLRGAAASRPVFLGAEDATGLSLSAAEIALLGGGGAAGTTNPATALRVTTAGTVTINGDVALGRGADTRIQALAIEGAASVAQTAGVVDVATLRGSSTGDFALNWLNAGAAVNTIGTLGQITATTGAVDIRNAAALSVTGPVLAGGAVTLGAGGALDLGTATINANSGAGATTLTAGGTISQTAGGAGALVTSRLNLASTGAAQSADLRGTGNQLAELQSSLGGAVALTNSAAATLTVAGTGIAAGAGDVTLTSGAIVVAAPTTTTGTASFVADTFSAAATVTAGTVELTPRTAGRDIALGAAVANTLALSQASASNLRTGTLRLQGDGATDITVGSLDLRGAPGSRRAQRLDLRGASVSQAAGGVLAVEDLTAIIGGALRLDQGGGPTPAANHINRLDTITAGGPVEIRIGGVAAGSGFRPRAVGPGGDLAGGTTPLTVIGTVSAGGTLRLLADGLAFDTAPAARLASTGGAITLGTHTPGLGATLGAADAAAAGLSLTPSAAGRLEVSGGAGVPSLTIATDGTLRVEGLFDLAGAAPPGRLVLQAGAMDSTTAGSLRVPRLEATATGAIELGAGAHRVGTVQLTAGSGSTASFTSTEALSVLGAAAPGSGQLGNVALTGPTLSLDGAVRGTTVSLATTGGAITQSAPLQAGTLDLATRGGDATLTQAGNSILRLRRANLRADPPATTGGTLRLVSAVALSLDRGGTPGLEAGDITLDAARLGRSSPGAVEDVRVIALGTAGGARGIVLRAPGGFDLGSGTLDAGSGAVALSAPAGGIATSGVSIRGGSLLLDAAGPLDIVGGSLAANGGALTLRSTGGTLRLNGVPLAGAGISLLAQGPLVVTASNVTTSGAFTASAGGALTLQDTAIAAGGLATLRGGSIAVTGGSLAGGAGVVVSADGSLGLSNATLAAPGADLTLTGGSFSVAGGALSAAGALTARATGGAASLQGPRLAAGGNLDVGSQGAMTLAAVTADAAQAVFRTSAEISTGVVAIQADRLILFAAPGGISQGAALTVTPRSPARLPALVLDSRASANVSNLGLAAQPDQPGLLLSQQPTQVRAAPRAEAPGTFGVATPEAAGPMQLNINAGNSPVFLLLGAGDATGQVNAGRLGVHGVDGSLRLVATLNARDGSGAAQFSDLTRPVAPAALGRYRINDCVVASVNCVVVPSIVVLPVRLNADVVVGLERLRQRDPDSLSPDVSPRDF